MPYKDKEKQKEAQKRYYLENKSKYDDRQRDRRSKLRKHIQDIKSSTPCTDCDIQYPYYMMEFDHLGDKEFNISQLGNFGSIKALQKEIDKCEVVCANCHKHRTWMRLVKTSEFIGE